MGIANPVLYRLACDHVMPGTENAIMVMCHQCGKIVAIKDVHEYEWVAKCSSCKFVRYTGLARGLADTIANLHVTNNPEHKAGIDYAPRPASTQRRRKLMDQGVINAIF